MNEKYLEDAWKDQKVFDLQLKCNLEQLSSKEIYPNHWKVSIETIQRENPKSLLDIGCGCGAFFKVCEDNLPDLYYCGCDYSSYAILLAKKTWNHECFFVEDVKNLTSQLIERYDMVFASALLDVSPNGDKMLEYLLSLKPKTVLLSRVKTTDKPSFYSTYKAYNQIDTCAFYHNIENLFNTFFDFGYDYEIITNDHFLLEKRAIN